MNEMDFKTISKLSMTCLILGFNLYIRKENKYISTGALKESFNSIEYSPGIFFTRFCMVYPKTQRF